MLEMQGSIKIQMGRNKNPILRCCSTDSLTLGQHTGSSTVRQEQQMKYFLFPWKKNMVTFFFIEFFKFV